MRSKKSGHRDAGDRGRAYDGVVSQACAQYGATGGGKYGQGSSVCFHYLSWEWKRLLGKDAQSSQELGFKCRFAYRFGGGVCGQGEQLSVCGATVQSWQLGSGYGKQAKESTGRDGPACEPRRSHSPGRHSICRDLVAEHMSVRLGVGLVLGRGSSCGR